MVVSNFTHLPRGMITIELQVSLFFERYVFLRNNLRQKWKTEDKVPHSFFKGMPIHYHKIFFVSVTTLTKSDFTHSLHKLILVWFLKVGVFGILKVSY